MAFGFEALISNPVNCWRNIIPVRVKYESGDEYDSEDEQETIVSDRSDKSDLDKGDGKDKMEVDQN